MNALTRKIVGLLNRSFVTKERINMQLMIANNVHSNNRILYSENNTQSHVVPYRFNVERKEKETFLEIVRMYVTEDKARINQLQFIAAALNYMDEFGVNKDLETYKAIFNVFPKGKYIPTNKYQIMLFHYIKHQNAALAILNKMEDNFVLPDYEMQQMILNTFGKYSLVIKKCWSMYYWLPKFSQLNPWPVPKPTPTDPKELAQLAIKKLASADVQANVVVYNTKDIPDAIDDTWIVSSMSRSQQELLAVQPTDKSLIVEGPFMIWVDQYYIDYYVLKGDPIKREIIYDDFHDVSDLKIPFWEKHHFKIPLTVHEQDDGVYYAMCATGTCSKDSLLSWIRCLQKTNPILEKIPITFKLSSATNEASYIEDANETSNVKQISYDTDTSEK
ncbi:evolutionarily conserved signaling intermediate in Toll pathway, mitochondrial [Xylocopa sonorina]|uniref:evolutionarily conserved signaling intermediate in Toll pathway, mitochondrial n=1 Tax=Xylocopa sonorina TaxID=1818115 RepID=UPI00403AF9C9